MRPVPRLKKRHRLGLTLVEVLLAVTIVSICLLSVLRPFLQATQTATVTWDNVKAMTEAEQLIGVISKMPWDKLGSAGTVVTSAATVAAAPVGSPTNVGDWNLYIDQVGPYSRSVRVDFVNLVNVSGTLQAQPSPTPTNIKRVSVSVNKNSQKHAHLTILLTNASP